MQKEIGAIFAVQIVKTEYHHHSYNMIIEYIITMVDKDEEVSIRR